MNWRRWTYFIFWIDPNFHSQTRLHTSKENVWNKDIGDTNSGWQRNNPVFIQIGAGKFYIYYKAGSRIYENLLWFSFPWGACLWEGLNCTRSSETCSSPAPTLHTYYISHILHISYIYHTYYILYIIYHTYYILQCGGIMLVTTKIWMIREKFQITINYVNFISPPGITTSLWLQLWKTTWRRAGSGRSSTIMKRSHCSILLLKENNKGLSKNILAIGGMRRWIIGCPLALIL